MTTTALETENSNRPAWWPQYCSARKLTKDLHDSFNVIVPGKLTETCMISHSAGPVLHTEKCMIIHRLWSPENTQKPVSWREHCSPLIAHFPWCLNCRTHVDTPEPEKYGKRWGEKETDKHTERHNRHSDSLSWSCILWFILAGSVPRPSGLSGVIDWVVWGHKGWFSGNFISVSSVGRHRQRFRQKQRRPALSDVVRPAFFLLNAASSVVDGALTDGSAEAVLARDMPNPADFRLFNYTMAQSCGLNWSEQWDELAWKHAAKSIRITTCRYMAVPRLKYKTCVTNWLHTAAVHWTNQTTSSMTQHIGPPKAYRAIWWLNLVLPAWNDTTHAHCLLSFDDGDDDGRQFVEIPNIQAKAMLVAHAGAVSFPDDKQHKTDWEKVEEMDGGVTTGLKTSGSWVSCETVKNTQILSAPEEEYSSVWGQSWRKPWSQTAFRYGFYPHLEYEGETEKMIEEIVIVHGEESALEDVLLTLVPRQQFRHSNFCFPWIAEFSPPPSFWNFQWHAINSESNFQSHTMSGESSF